MFRRIGLKVFLELKVWDVYVDFEVFVSVDFVFSNEGSVWKRDWDFVGFGL